jgi:hypothetical protein
MKHVVVVAALTAALVVAVAPEASGKGGTPISSCGQTVTMNAIVTQDLNCTNSSGIVIGADGITIDLNGHTIRGPGYDCGIQDSLFDKLTVKNGTLANFEEGVFAVSADGVTVSNVIAAGNVEAGST